MCLIIYKKISYFHCSCIFWGHVDAGLAGAAELWSQRRFEPQVQFLFGLSGGQSRICGVGRAATDLRRSRRKGSRRMNFAAVHQQHEPLSRQPQETQRYTGFLFASRGAANWEVWDKKKKAMITIFSVPDMFSNSRAAWTQPAANMEKKFWAFPSCHANSLTNHCTALLALHTCLSGFKDRLSAYEMRQSDKWNVHQTFTAEAVWSASNCAILAKHHKVDRTYAWSTVTTRSKYDHLISECYHVIRWEVACDINSRSWSNFGQRSSGLNCQLSETLRGARFHLIEMHMVPAGDELASCVQEKGR